LKAWLDIPRNINCATLNISLFTPVLRSRIMLIGYWIRLRGRKMMRLWLRLPSLVFYSAKLFTAI
jgi:hypothetical protein